MRLAIGLTVFARLSALLALFLPLKIILLVGSETIPRYFTGFISQESRDLWIWGLAATAVILYLTSVVSESWAKKLSSRGSQSALFGLEKLTQHADQDSVLAGYYTRICGVAACLAFAILLFVCGVALYPGLFLFAFGCCAVLYVSSSIILRPALPTNLGIYLKEKTSQYLDFLSTIVFLLVFAYLLVAYLAGNGPNILIALVSVLITRQLLSNLASFVMETARLARDRTSLDALLFQEHKAILTENRESARLRELYSLQERTIRTAGNLNLEQSQVSSNWNDHSIGGLSVFSIETTSPQSRSRFREVVYPPSATAYFENESIVFDQIEASDLRGPKLVCEYNENEFRGRIFEVGDAIKLSRKDWLNELDCHYMHHWALETPEPLVRRFCSTKQLLHERIDQQLLSRLEIAISTSEQTEDYERLVGALPSMQEIVAKIPLFVFNPFARMDLAYTGEGGVTTLLGWGGWRLEPLGVGISPQRLRQGHDYVKSTCDVRRVEFNHILLASTLWTLERQISSRRLTGAFPLARQACALAEEFQ